MQDRTPALSRNSRSFIDDISMKFTLGAVLGLASAVSAAIPCTITASGGDDAPALLRALKACREVWVPKNTTLSIRTALNATGLNNVHLNLAGTIKYYEDLEYWAGHAFPFGEWFLGNRQLGVAASKATFRVPEHLHVLPPWR